MQLYAGSSTDFIKDATRNAIASKLEAAFFEHLRYKPSSQEVRSWQNSLARMSLVLLDGEFSDQGVLLEYQLPLSSRRLDCLITGLDSAGVPHSVIVELKQWDDVEASDADDCVVTWLAGRKRDVLHPSRQVAQYEQYLKDMHITFSAGDVGLRSCAFLHNFQYDDRSEIYASKHQGLLARYPAFAGDQQDKLVSFLSEHVGQGKGLPILDKVIASRYAPSRKLLDHTSRVIEGQRSFILLDDQQVVLNKVLSEVRKSAQTRTKKTIVLVRGGPGTGKSVIALHLVGKLSSEGFNVQHLTGSKAFTENLRKVVGSRAAAQFGYFNLNKRGEIPLNHFDALILDEAHRIRETSKDRFTKSSDWSGKRQIEELLEPTKVAVFFIDDCQVVRPGEVGSCELIRSTAKAVGAHLIEFELETQFRCGGSDGFVNWVDNTLGVRRTANVLWSRDSGYDFRVVESPAELEAAMRLKAQNNGSARLVAGYCWPWSAPNSDGSLANDVTVGDWSKPWNAKPNAGKLAKGIPNANFWASDPGGLEQVGCIYTAQGFEFDYVGVIFGTDLRYDWSKNEWIGDRTKSCDAVVKRSGDRIAELIKNTYRVLLTRGMRGCYVYFVDEGTKRFFQSRLE